MSHVEYIKSCDEDQLAHLVELANARLLELRQKGWVTLWVVSDSNSNHGWFSLDQYAQALEFLLKTGTRYAAAGQARALDISKQRFRPDEAKQLVEDTAAEARAARPAQ